jgi:hypothetical protein
MVSDTDHLDCIIKRIRTVTNSCVLQCPRYKQLLLWQKGLQLCWALPTTRPPSILLLPPTPPIPPPIPPPTPPPAPRMAPAAGPRPKKRRARPPTKGAQQAASPARVVAVGSTLQGTQACTLSRAYATEVDAALAAAIRRPLTAGTTSKERFCPYTCASSVLLCFLMFFALRRQAHRPDGWEGALVAQTCVAMYVAE